MVAYMLGMQQVPGSNLAPSGKAGKDPSLKPLRPAACWLVLSLMELAESSRHALILTCPSFF